MEELHSGSGGNAAMLQLIGVFEVIHLRSEKHVWSATVLGCHEEAAGLGGEAAGHGGEAGQVEVAGHVETGGLGSEPAEHLRAGGVGAEHAGFGWREEFGKMGNNAHTVSEFSFLQRI
jgi:hypothetical protein